MARRTSTTRPPGARARAAATGSRCAPRCAGAWPGRARERAGAGWRSFRRAAPSVQIAIDFAATLALWAAVNGVYQVLRKPTELFFPVSGMLYKTPAGDVEPLRVDLPPALHARDHRGVPRCARAGGGLGQPDRADLLALVVGLNPLEVYRPASSAVGMYQITDGTFEEASRYCIHDHAVVEEGPWYAWRSCWLNELYFRVVPSHSVELTSAYLDRAVARRSRATASAARRVAQKQTSPR